jgi:hypothetical protein
MFEDMQLEEWTRLSGLTYMTLRLIRRSHHTMLIAVLPRLTALRSLVLDDPWYPEQGLQSRGAHCAGQLLQPDEPCHVC